MLKCLEDAHGGLLKIEYHQVNTANDDCVPNLTIHLEDPSIEERGRKALGQLLLNLQINRCIADVPTGTEYYERLTAVEETHLRWRNAVVAHKQSRPLFVQANTFFSDNEVTLKEYPATKEGLIQSWAERMLQGRESN